MTSVGTVSIKTRELLPKFPARKNEWKQRAEIARKNNSFESLALRHIERTAGGGGWQGDGSERPSVPSTRPSMPTLVPGWGRLTQVCKLRMWIERETELWVSQTEDHNQVSVQQKAGENEDRNTSSGRVLEERKSKIPSFKARSEFGFHQSLV